MAWKSKKKDIAAGPIRIDRTIYRIVGEEWEMLPLSDHWVRYMAVLHRHKNNPDVFDVRIYDEWCTEHRGVRVSNYESLDFHPELVLFEGWFDRKARNGSIHLNRAKLQKVA